MSRRCRLSCLWSTPAVRHCLVATGWNSSGLMAARLPRRESETRGRAAYQTSGEPFLKPSSTSMRTFLARIEIGNVECVLKDGGLSTAMVISPRSLNYRRKDCLEGASIWLHADGDGRRVKRLADAEHTQRLVQAEPPGVWSRVRASTLAAVNGSNLTRNSVHPVYFGRHHCHWWRRRGASPKFGDRLQASERSRFASQPAQVQLFPGACGVLRSWCQCSWAPQDPCQDRRHQRCTMPSERHGTAELSRSCELLRSLSPKPGNHSASAEWVTAERRGVALDRWLHDGVRHGEGANRHRILCSHILTQRYLSESQATRHLMDLEPCSHTSCRQERSVRSRLHLGHCQSPKRTTVRSTKRHLESSGASRSSTPTSMVVRSRWSPTISRLQRFFIRRNIYRRWRQPDYKRYALFLAGYRYSIVYRKTTDHGNADGLSRLPLDNPGARTDNDADVEAFHVSQFDVLPVTADQVRQATRQDPTLAAVFNAVQSGDFSDCASHQSFISRRNELTTHQGCVLWGARVVVP